jgi:glycogen debranching enzyme
VWPWLLGPFIEAYIKVYGHGGVSFVRNIFTEMEASLKEKCIGTVPEIYDGNEPHIPRGAVAQAWSVAELLRVKSMIDKVY